MDFMKYCERRSKIVDKIKTVILKAVCRKYSMAPVDKADQVYANLSWLFGRIEKINIQEAKARAKTVRPKPGRSTKRKPPCAACGFPVKRNGQCECHEI